MRTLGRHVLDRYEREPDRVAIVLQHAGQPDDPVTFRELVEGAAGFARALDEARVAPGSVVVIILQHGRPLVNAFWGAVLHGAPPAIMPFLTEKLSPDKYRRDLAALFGVTRPGAVVTYAGFEAEVRTALGDVRARPPGFPPVPVIVGEAVAAAAPPDDAAGSEDAIALLQHSSGSTGLQKGVALSHRAIFNQIDAYADAIRLSQDDVIVSWLPLYHDMGLIASFVMPVLTGTPLVLMSPFDWVRAPARLMQAIGRYRGTLCWLPNFAYNFCAQKSRDRDLEGVRLDTMRAFVNCSEPMYAASHRLFLERFAPLGLRESALATCYAMAENVFAVSQGGVDGPVAIDGGRPSAGRLLPNVEARILAPGDGRERTELGPGEVGEIALRSDCMLTGYYHRPDATAQAFHAGWFLTGDLGYFKGGDLFVTGRIKDLIIVGGKNVYPQDLEQIAGDVPGVHPGRVVAFGVMNTDAGTEDVCVLAEADSADPDDRAALALAIRQTIAKNSDVSARHVELYDVGSLIKTSSGKIARAANKERYLAAMLLRDLKAL